MLLKKLSKRVLENTGEVSYEEAVELSKYPDKNALYTAAHSIRKQFCGNKFDTCSVLNIRSGLCSEDCKWCAQSAKHKTDIKIYPLLDGDTVFDSAVKNDAKDINRLALVTSGRKVQKDEMQKICEMYKHIQKKTDLKLCASMGLLNKEELLLLKGAGISRYHCNLETAPSFFPEVCSTHTYEDKKQTLLLALECGLDICSGGIIGLGESMEQRIEMACELRSLGVKSVPVNILYPAKGTKLENAAPLSDYEILTTIAVFRFLLPDASLRFAGGRITMREDLQVKALETGINAAIVGDLLTISGPDVEKDYEMFEKVGYDYGKKIKEYT